MAPADFLGNLILVDAAKDVRRYRVGGVLPYLYTVRTWLCPEGPCNQQVAELMGIAGSIRRQYAWVGDLSRFLQTTWWAFHRRFGCVRHHT